MARFNVKDLISLGGAVAESLAKNAAKDSTKLEQSDVKKVEPSVTAAAEKSAVEQLQPVIDHLTNNEASIWQKRTFWSYLVSGVLVVAAPLALRFGIDFGWLDEKTREDIITALTTIGGIWAGWAAYRAGTATKPLGS